MVYKYLRYYSILVLRLFTRNIQINGLDNLPVSGPVLLASNHPNSFFDAIVYSCMFNRPIYSLARGDAFKKNFAKKLLSMINMMPIYRISEGKENLSKNDETFVKCNKVFSNNGVVLIFSEGLCTHQTQLLSLKKGTARLVHQSWTEGSDVTVVPVGINYDGFVGFGRKIEINVGSSILKKDYSASIAQQGVFVRKFNQDLFESMDVLFKGISTKRSWLFSGIHALGWLLHFPLYLILIYLVKQKTKGTVFYDSILYGAILFTLPFYWLILWSVLFWLIW